MEEEGIRHFRGFDSGIGMETSERREGCSASNWDHVYDWLDGNGAYKAGY